MVNFFRTTAFHRARFLESLRPSVRPCRRSSRPCRRDRPCVRALVQSQVALVEVRRSRPSQIALIISTDTEDADGEIEGCTASPLHLSRRPWLSSARASPSRAWNGSTDGRRAPHRREAAVFALRARSTGRTRTTAEVYERVLRRSTRRFGRGAGLRSFRSRPQG